MALLRQDNRLMLVRSKSLLRGQSTETTFDIRAGQLSSDPDRDRVIFHAFLILFLPYRRNYWGKSFHQFSLGSNAEVGGSQLLCHLLQIRFLSFNNNRMLVGKTYLEPLVEMGFEKRLFLWRPERQWHRSVHLL